MSTHQPKPLIRDLGPDLLILSRSQLLATLLLPFLFFLLYFVFALNEIWSVAVLCTMALSFLSYGSTSHDLVHETLKINKTLNTILLTTLELICFRSGHAYKLSHLYHHSRFPSGDDVEGAAARMSFFRTLLEGVIFQPKIYLWAARRSSQYKYHKLIIFEGLSVLLLVGLCIFSASYTAVFIIYMCLMIAGSWIIPLITSYAVHSPDGETELTQTRLFRGSFFSILAFNHLFHLEHHLYPMVPHRNWPKLARRLDSYFSSNHIRPIKVNL